MRLWLESAIKQSRDEDSCWLVVGYALLSGSILILITLNFVNLQIIADLSPKSGHLVMIIIKASCTQQVSRVHNDPMKTNYDENDPWLSTFDDIQSIEEPAQ